MPWVTESSDPVQREIDKQKGMGKHNPTKGEVDPAVEELAKADYAASAKEEPFSYKKPGETIVSSPTQEQGPPTPGWQDLPPVSTTNKPSIHIPGYTGDPMAHLKDAFTPRTSAADLTPEYFGNVIAGGLMGAAGGMLGGPGGAIAGGIAGALATPLFIEGQKREQEKFGKMGYNPEEAARRANISSTILGLETGMTGQPKVTEKPSTLPRVSPLEPNTIGPVGEPPPRVLEPDAILGKGAKLPNPTQQLNRQPGKTMPPPREQLIPTREEVGLKPEPVEPVVGQGPIKETQKLWKKWWDNEKFKWGQELPVIRTQADSPVISGVENHHVWVEGQLEEMMKEPWAQSILHDFDGGQWEAMETEAVRIWKNGNMTGKAYMDAIQSAPEPFQQMMVRRDLMYAIENEIRKRRNLSPIPKTDGPYIPRVTTDEWKHLRQVSGGGRGAGKQTVGTHQHERVFETTEEGRTAGIKYKDPRAGWLSREYNGFTLQATDNLITDLEQKGVLHTTREGALGASPTGKPMRVSGIPFEPEGGWWVRTEEEAQFLRQHFEPGKGGEYTRLANQFVRTPSLVIPFAHLLKNMMVKYGLTTVASKGKLSHLMPDVLEWKYKKNPAMLSRFETVMPFTASGKNAFEIMQNELPHSPMEQVERGIGYMNRWSQKKIFRDWDPALRYAKWREYVRQGMSDQEAANHTWVDLIRYGTRSDRIDAWKALPGNFFIPWRVGAVRTLMKAFKQAPVRAMAFVGFVDALREIDYRNTGHWTHMPQDYLERPLMELAHGRGKGALATLFATTIAGPGGDYFLKTLITMAQDAQLKGNWHDMKNLYWGLAQVTGTVEDFKKFEATGQPKHLLNIMGQLLLGRHETPYGAPARLFELVPEAAMGKTSGVKASEERGQIARGEKPKPAGLGGGLGGGLMK